MARYDPARSIRGTALTTFGSNEFQKAEQGAERPDDYYVWPHL
jgi:hypothetical protein